MSFARLLFVAWVSLGLPGCSLALQWNRSSEPGADAALFDAPPPPDGTAPDAPVVDSARPDVQSGCGGNGERCCGLSCDSNLVCNGRTCEPCGGNDQRCCSLLRCQGTRVCTGRLGETFLCRDCGGSDQPCCAGRMCSSGRRCDQRGGDPYPICR